VVVAKNAAAKLGATLRPPLLASIARAFKVVQDLYTREQRGNHAFLHARLGLGHDQLH